MKLAIVMALACAWSSAAVAQPRMLKPSEIQGDPSRWVPESVWRRYDGQRVDIVGDVVLREAHINGRLPPGRFTNCRIVGPAAGLPHIDGVATFFERNARPRAPITSGEVIYTLEIRS